MNAETLESVYPTQFSLERDRSRDGLYAIGAFAGELILGGIVSEAATKASHHRRVGGVAVKQQFAIEYLPPHTAQLPSSSLAEVYAYQTEAYALAA